MELPKRKKLRLSEYDYSSNGAYFITLCSKEMACIFSGIVGDGASDVPKTSLTEYGKAVENEIIKINGIYDNINVSSYVIMPNHIHLIIIIEKAENSGTSRAPSPTNSVVSRYVSTLKRFTNKKCNAELWQRGFNDHIIRNEEDYLLHLQYIDENPKKWLIGKDEYYA